MPLPFKLQVSEEAKQRVDPEGGRLHPITEEDLPAEPPKTPLPNLRPSMAARLRVNAEKIRQREQNTGLAGKAIEALKPVAKTVGRKVQDVSRELGETFVEFGERTARNVRESVEAPTKVAQDKQGNLFTDVLDSLEIFDLPFAPLKAATEQAVRPHVSEETARTIGEFSPVVGATGVSLLERARKIPQLSIATAEILGIPGMREEPLKVIPRTTQSRFLAEEAERLRDLTRQADADELARAGKKTLSEIRPTEAIRPGELIDVPEAPQRKTQVIEPGEVTPAPEIRPEAPTPAPPARTPTPAPTRGPIPKGKTSVRAGGATTQIDESTLPQGIELERQLSDTELPEPMLQAMRRIRERSDAFLRETNDIGRRQGDRVPAGNAAFDPALRGQGLADFLTELGKGTNPRKAAEIAKEKMRALVRSNNARRKDINAQRDLNAGQDVINRALREILDVTGGTGGEVQGVILSQRHVEDPELGDVVQRVLADAARRRQPAVAHTDDLVIGSRGRARVQPPDPNGNRNVITTQELNESGTRRAIMSFTDQNGEWEQGVSYNKRADEIRREIQQNEIQKRQAQEAARAADIKANEVRQAERDTFNTDLTAYLKTQKFKKGNFDVQINARTGRGRTTAPQEGMVLGDWAVHRLKDEAGETSVPGYRVTHVPSGLSADNGLKQTEARRLAAALHRTGIQLNPDGSPKDPKDLQRLGAIVRALKNNDSPAQALAEIEAAQAAKRGRSRGAGRGASGFPEPPEPPKSLEEVLAAPEPPTPQSVSPLPATPNQPPVPANYDILTRPRGGLFRRTPKDAALIAQRTEMLTELRQRLGVPIRKGVLGKRGVLGFFKLKEEVIRLKFANDIDTTAHEVGHFLSKNILGWEYSRSTRSVPGIRQKATRVGKRAREFKDELIPLGKALYGDKKPNGGYAEEGIAEFVRMFVTNPDEAQQKAPRFWNEFNQILDKNPDVRAVLEETRMRYALWRQQGPIARTLARISFKGQPDPDKTLSLTDRLTTYFVDDLHPLKVIRDRMAGKIPFSPTDDFYLLARLLRGLNGKVDSFLRFRTFDFDTLEGNGKSLKAILDPIANALPTSDPQLRSLATGALVESSRGQRVARRVGADPDINLALFRAYLVAKRDLELAKRGIRTGQATPTQLGTKVAADSQQVVGLLEEQYPAFAQAQRELVAFQDRVLNYYRKAGMLSTDAVAAMRRMNQEYIPFYRLIEEESPVGESLHGTRVVDLFQKVKRIKGSDADIIDPLESVIKNTYALINLAERNNVARALVRAAKSREGLGAFLEGPIPRSKMGVKVTFEEAFREALRKNATGQLALPDDVVRGLEEVIFSDPELGRKIFTVFRPSLFKPKEPNIIQVMIAGEPIYYRVNPELYRALNALDIEQINLTTRILSTPARTLRLGATSLNPEFAVKNFVRDQFSAFLFTNYGYRPGVDFAKGVFSALNQDEAYLAWKAAGGEQAMLVSLDRTRRGRGLADVLAQPSTMREEARHILFHPIDAIRAFSEFSEVGTRLGEFRNVLEKELTLEGKDRLLQAALESREITLDFARKGAKMRAIANMTAFMNANIQGMSKAYRTMKEKPRDFAVRASAIMGTSILLYLANRDDPRVQEIPQWQRDTFWIVPSGEMDKETWAGMSPAQKAEFSETHPIFRIPKPYEYGVAFGSMPERILEWMDEQNPKALDDSLLELGSRLGFQIMPNVLRVPIDVLSNHMSFFDRPIISRRVEDLSPEAQYGTFTTETAKEIGGVFNTSPAVIDYLAGALFGRSGLSALEASDAVVRRLRGLPPPPKGSLADVFLVRSFVSRFPNLQGPTMETFWDRYTEAKTVDATARFYDSEAKAAGRGTTGRIYQERAKAYREDNRDLLRQFNRLDQAYEAIRNLQKRMTRVRRSDLIPEKKRTELDTLTFRIQEIGERAIEPRNMQDRINALIKRVQKQPTQRRTMGELLQRR